MRTNFDHITIYTVNTNSYYYLCIIRDYKKLIERHFNITKFTLDEVVSVRNSAYKKFKIDRSKIRKFYTKSNLLDDIDLDILPWIRPDNPTNPEYKDVGHVDFA
jgi:hypothetical protein